MNGGRVTSAVRALGSQRFIASFTSHEPGKHTVQITFNGETVPGKLIILYEIIRMDDNLEKKFRSRFEFKNTFSRMRAELSLENKAYVASALFILFILFVLRQILYI